LRLSTRPEVGVCFQWGRSDQVDRGIEAGPKRGSWVLSPPSDRGGRYGSGQAEITLPLSPHREAGPRWTDVFPGAYSFSVPNLSVLRFRSSAAPIRPPNVSAPLPAARRICRPIRQPCAADWPVPCPAPRQFSFLLQVFWGGGGALPLGGILGSRHLYENRFGKTCLRFQQRTQISLYLGVPGRDDPQLAQQRTLLWILVQNMK